MEPTAVHLFHNFESELNWMDFCRCCLGFVVVVCFLCLCFSMPPVILVYYFFNVNVSVYLIVFAGMSYWYIL